MSFSSIFRSISCSLMCIHPSNSSNVSAIKSYRFSFLKMTCTIDLSNWELSTKEFINICKRSLPSLIRFKNDNIFSSKFSLYSVNKKSAKPLIEIRGVLNSWENRVNKFDLISSNSLLSVESCSHNLALIASPF